MNCTYHIQNAITSICIATHLCECQRKLCIDCLYDHEVEIKKNTVPIKLFREKVIQKLKEHKLDQTLEVTKEKMSFKLLLSQTESMLKTIWEDLSNSIQQIYDMIDMEDQSYLRIINDNINPAELSNTDLEKLVQIVEGQLLNDWNTQKNSYLQKLEKTKNWWEQEVKAFSKKLKDEIKEMQSLIQVQPIQQDDFVYEKKEDLYDILASLKDLDVSMFNIILGILKDQKISDIKGFLEREDTRKHFNVNNQERQKFINVIRSIYEHDFNRNDYSSDKYLNTKVELIKRIEEDKKLIELLKFFVNITAIDSKYIQCGSNSLNILVEMKVDLKNHNFENIRINNTSLIRSNFTRCNLNGSEFNNINISGMNLNGASLFNCKWKNITMQEISILDGHTSSVKQVCFSPDGTIIASGCYDNFIYLWDVKTGQQKLKLYGHQSSVISVCFSPDGTTLASGSDDKSIYLWNVNTGQYRSKLDGHTSYVYSVCFSPDGAILASGSNDKTIRLWDVKTKQQKSKLYGHTNTVYSVCFSPDGTTLASGSSDNSIRLWDVQTGYQISKLIGHTSYVYSVCFSPDGIIIASGSNDKSIRLWDFITGEQKSKFDGNTKTVHSLCFSPDGNTLTSGSADLSIRLWDVKTGQQKSKLDGHSQEVMSVCFSPDGNTLASGSADMSIRLWDVKTGQQNSELDGHSREVMSVCFSPDGATLASSGSDNSIRLWDIKTGKEIQSTDQSYKDILAHFKTPLFLHNPLPESVSTIITILLISPKAIFQAQGALILQGEFVTQSGIDLKTLFQQLGSCFLENQVEIKEK